MTASIATRSLWRASTYQFRTLFANRRIPEALSTSRGKAGVSDGNWIQTLPGKGWNTILRTRHVDRRDRRGLAAAQRQRQLVGGPHAESGELKKALRGRRFCA
jgi:hypothetical protein